MFYPPSTRRLRYQPLFILLLLFLMLQPRPGYPEGRAVIAEGLGVQEFLEHQPGVLKDYREGGLTAAEIIENSSLYYGLSPRLHLATMETVTKLLSDAYAMEQTIQQPFGRAGPTGFSAQVEWFSREMRAGLGPYDADSPPVMEFTDGVTLALSLEQAPEGVAVQLFLAIGRTSAEWYYMNRRFVKVFEYYFQGELPDLHSAVDGPSEPVASAPAPAPTSVPGAPEPTVEPEPAPIASTDPHSGASVGGDDLRWGFLQLPWPAGTRVTHLAYFDHTYPTVDSGHDGNNVVMTYWGIANVQYNTHDGHDYTFPDQMIGTPILASAPGRAFALSYPGNGVVIQHANGYETVYWHLDRFHDRFHGLVDTGRSVWVQTGEVLGTSGMSGFSVGTPHLHFEVRYYGKQVDPYGWYGEGPDPCVAYAGCAYSVWLWHPDLLGTYDFTPPNRPGSRAGDPGILVGRVSPGVVVASAERDTIRMMESERMPLWRDNEVLAHRVAVLDEVRGRVVDVQFRSGRSTVYFSMIRG